MKWRLNEDSKIIVPGSVTDNWYFFNGHSFEAITPTVNGGNLEFTVSKNKAVISLIRTNFDVLDISQRYGKIKAESIKESLKETSCINAHRVIEDNLLTDGSFEEWDDPNDLTHWSEGHGGSSSVNQDSINTVDGDYSVRLDIDTDGNYVQIWQYRYPADLESDGYYKLSFWYKSESKGLQVTIRKLKDGTSYYWDGSKWKTGEASIICSETAIWTHKEIIFTLEDAGDITLLHIQFGRESGTAGNTSKWVDNAKLEKIGVIEHYDARGDLKVTANSTDIKIYAVDSQSSNQAELDKVGIG